MLIEMNEDLAGMGIGELAGGVFVEVDIDAPDIGRELTDALEFVTRMRAQVGRHLDVLTEHDDIHVVRSIEATAQSVFRTGVRAAVATATDAAPASCSARAA